jgi:exopolyphosphatase / guanosine-5'-triphosphate,3'-diphosphate pyrophosphatase
VAGGNGSIGGGFVGGSRRLAAIDIGTVTTRLLIADVSAAGVTEVERSTDITHLGEGLGGTGRLSDAAMRRVADVVGRYAVRVRDLGVERLSTIATSASRDAENGAEFRALLVARGVVPEIIRGDQEAQLAFIGATSDFAATEGLLVVDLGGGSTELILGDVGESNGVRASEIIRARSLDVGSKRVTELFLHSDPPKDAELAQAREWTNAQLRPFFDGLRVRPSNMISVAGTATSLSAIHMGLATYDPERVHGSRLTGSELADLTEMLAAMPLAARKRVVGLHPDRASVMVAGALILETVVALSGLESTLVGERDILYGILLDTYRKLQEGELVAEQTAR